MAEKSNTASIDGEDNMATMSATSTPSKLTQTALEKTLITTIHGEISALKNKLVTELQSSIVELKSAVVIHTTQIADIETLLTSADKRLQVLEQKCSLQERTNSNSSLRLKLDDL